MFDDEEKSLEEHALREMISTVVADLRKYSAAADALLADDAQRGMLVTALRARDKRELFIRHLYLRRFG
jgi:hypothetical protein